MWLWQFSRVEVGATELDGTFRGGLQLKLSILFLFSATSPYTDMATHRHIRSATANSLPTHLQKQKRSLEEDELPNPDDGKKHKKKRRNDDGGQEVPVKEGAKAEGKGGKEGRKGRGEGKEEGEGEGGGGGERKAKGKEGRKGKGEKEREGKEGKEGKAKEGKEGKAKEKKERRERKAKKEKEKKEKGKKEETAAEVGGGAEPAPAVETTPKKAKKRKHAADGPPEAFVVEGPGPLAAAPNHSHILQKMRQSLALVSSKSARRGATEEKDEAVASSAKEPRGPPAPEETPGTGHQRILLKARRSLAKVPVQAPPEPASETVPAVEATGPEPLPQPESVKAPKPISSLSTLPPWLREPISVLPTTKTPFSSISALSSKLQSRLASLSLSEAFAVQTAVLPLLLDRGCGEDLCVSAATGSGKTLAYVLPIIQSLSSRVVTRLRAIVVVPTRELVQQVNATAVSIASGTGLKMGTAIGSRSLAMEQGLLVAADEGDGMPSSKVDVLITTPGRLVEHVRATPGFDLTWVEWLVIDEADRLLAQSFQEWVDVVIVGLEKAATQRAPVSVAGVDLGDLGLRPLASGRERVRKIVLSATMTRDVGKLAALRLRKPKLVVVEDPPLPEGGGGGNDCDAEMGGGDHCEDGDEELEQFSVPAGLREHVTPVDDVECKPLYLMCLLRQQAIKSGILVFVKSNEGAARLAKLLETVLAEASSTPSFTVGLVTGEMEKKRREKVLKRFAKGEVDL